MHYFIKSSADRISFMKSLPFLDKITEVIKSIKSYIFTNILIRNRPDFLKGFRHNSIFCTDNNWENNNNAVNGQNVF